jgi:hypothetical protein
MVDYVFTALYLNRNKGGVMKLVLVPRLDKALISTLSPILPLQFKCFMYTTAYQIGCFNPEDRGVIFF